MMVDFIHDNKVDRSFGKMHKEFNCSIIFRTKHLGNCPWTGSRVSSLVLYYQNSKLLEGNVADASADPLLPPGPLLRAALLFLETLWWLKHASGRPKCWRVSTPEVPSSGVQQELVCKCPSSLIWQVEQLWNGYISRDPLQNWIPVAHNGNWLHDTLFNWLPSLPCLIHLLPYYCLLHLLNKLFSLGSMSRVCFWGTQIKTNG